VSEFPILGCPVVVTGADGFIGRALVAQLRGAGANVVAIDADPAIEGTVKADICDPDIGRLVPQGSVVIHLAALSTDGSCRQDPVRAVEVNVQGTLNLARASRENAVRQFIFASSEWIYGDASGEMVQSEDTPIDVARLTSFYAVTKAAAEPMLRSPIGPDNVTILRFGIVYGPRPDSWSAVERLLMDVSEKPVVHVGSLRTGRRFIYVDDLVAGILASIGQAGFCTFNISGDVMVTMGDIISTSAKLLGRNPEVVESSPNDWVQRNPSNAFAVRTLNWTPQYDIASGLRAVAEYLGLLPTSSEGTGS
jgi:UDP-glucose 4-epimerase